MRYFPRLHLSFSTAMLSCSALSILYLIVALDLRAVSLSLALSFLHVKMDMATCNSTLNIVPQEHLAPLGRYCLPCASGCRASARNRVGTPGFCDRSSSTLIPTNCVSFVNSSV
ncbi:hypothetical protein DFH06DRAFT_1241963 [Mycena polygramma]|nr:hypothetical protein DFH06DRAFT_1241963 [Mycena polygramma]